MKILMIAGVYPPLLNAEAICNGKLALALSQAGAEVTVVTQNYPDTQGQRDDSACWDGNALEVVRFDPPSPPLLTKLANLPAKAASHRLATWFSAAAYRYCGRLLQTRQYDLVLTRSNPADSTIAGYRLKKKCRHIKWVAGLNDPDPYCMYPEPYGRGRPHGYLEKAQVAWTRAALDLANYALFPCERLGKYMANKLELDLGPKTIIMPHIGWSRPPQKASNGKLTILHAGSLLTRNGSAVLKGLCREISKIPALKNRISIVLMGKHNRMVEEQIKDFDHEGVLSLQDAVSYEQSLYKIAEADALLLIEAVMEEGIYLPSKFCDYAASAKPLLLYTPETGSISDLVGGYRHPGFLGQEEPRVGERIGAFLLKAANRQSLEDYRYPRPHDFDPQKIAGQILSLS